jgi:hypothetical protein
VNRRNRRCRRSATGTTLPNVLSSLDIVGPGAPPFTPGDAAFRTTLAEAPTSRDSTFVLTYSLGEIVQLAPPEVAGTGGFAPAAAGAGTAGGLRGPIALGDSYRLRHRGRHRVLLGHRLSGCRELSRRLALLALAALAASWPAAAQQLSDLVPAPPGSAREVAPPENDAPVPLRPTRPAIARPSSCAASRSRERRPSPRRTSRPSGPI